MTPMGPFPDSDWRSREPSPVTTTSVASRALSRLMRFDKIEARLDRGLWDESGEAEGEPAGGAGPWSLGVDTVMQGEDAAPSVQCIVEPIDSVGAAGAFLGCEDVGRAGCAEKWVADVARQAQRQLGQAVVEICVVDGGDVVEGRAAWLEFLVVGVEQPNPEGGEGAGASVGHG